MDFVLPYYIEKNRPVKYTGKAWKHHLSSNNPEIGIGAAKGSTIFTDFDKMIDYLKKDGRDWHIAELELNNDVLKFEFGNDFMATILHDKISKYGFNPLIIQ